MKRTSQPFMSGTEMPKQQVGDGLTRQLFGYDDSILMARVEFETGAVGEVHSHPHSQVSYVESGQFDVYVDGVTQRLAAGDSFYIQPNLDHGAVCCAAGALIDVFSPARADFLDEDEQ